MVDMMRRISALAIMTLLLLNTAQSTSNDRGDDSTYIYTEDVGNLKDVKIIEVHFKNAFRGADQDIATVDSIWQVSDSDPSRVIYTSSDETEFNSGTPLELREGYELAISAIDLDGDEVYVQLMKDGMTIDFAIVIPPNTENESYIYTSDNVKTIEVHFKNAFRGAVQDIATVDSIWQVSDSDPSRVIYTSSDETEFNTGTPLELREGYELAISAIDLHGDKVYVELMKNGMTIDSAIVLPPNTEDGSYTYTSDNVKIIEVHFKNAFRGTDQDIATVDSIWQISDSDPSRVIYTSSDKTEFNSGTSLELKEGYELAISAIDLDGDKVYVELMKDGMNIDSAIVLPPNTENGTYTYTYDNVKIIEVHFKNVFRGAYQDVAVVDSIRQVSEAPPHNTIYNMSDKASFTTGTPKELEESYELVLNGVNLDNDMAYVELYKIGEIVDSELVSVGTIPQVQASEILAKIKKGEMINYDGVIIEGNLNLRDPGIAEDAKTVSSPIKITDSWFKGDVNFRNIVFQDSVNFRGSIFNGDADFKRAKFDRYSSFRQVRFVGCAQFQEAQFSDYVDFRDTQFNDYYLVDDYRCTANFSDAQFGGYADFWKAQFSSNADFEEAQFSGYADFEEAQFSGYADFEEAQFNDYAGFRWAEFSSYTDFWGGRFSGYADFWGAKFSDDADFRWTQFSDDADFRWTQFSDDADFEEAQFSDSRNLNTDFGNAIFDGNAIFVDTQFSKYADFREARFNSSLDLTHARFDRLELRWGAIENHLNCDDTAYMALIKNYETLGWFGDSDECYYQYRRETQAKRNWSEGTKYLDALAWFSCGYGVYPKHTLILSFVLVILFGVTFRVGGALKEIQRIQHEEQKISVSLIESIYFSALVFIHTWPHPKLRPSGRWKYVVLAEDVAGWLLLALFLVTLGNVMIR